MRAALIPFLVLLVPGCERSSGSSEVVAQLKDINKRMARMEKTIDRLGTGRGAGGAAGAPNAQPRQPRRGPDPAVAHTIATEGAPSKGNPKAPVTIVEAFEFACPACEGTRPFVDQVLEKFGDRVRLVQKTFIVHPGRADIPAYAGCAANLQGKWDVMEDLIWDEGFKAGDLSREKMIALAGKAGLDLARFGKDMDGACVATIKKSHDEMQKLGTSGTPTFFVNGRVLQRRSLDDLEQMIAEEEKKAPPGKNS